MATMKRAESQGVERDHSNIPEQPIKMIIHANEVRSLSSGPTAVLSYDSQLLPFCRYSWEMTLSWTSSSTTQETWRW